MFIGHFAVGYASKKAAPGVSLAVLLAAPLLADILWPALLLAGAEHVRIIPGWTAMNALDLHDYPWSHSLLMLAVWGALAGILVARMARSSVAGWVVFGGVLSHWLLDWVTHKPDMPLWPAGPEYGLYLWRSVPATMIVEIVLYAIGVAMWLGATRARNRRGAIGAWVFIVLNLVFYVLDRFSPPPPDARTIAVAALIATTLLLIFAWWLDRHREART